MNLKRLAIGRNLLRLTVMSALAGTTVMMGFNCSNFKSKDGASDQSSSSSFNVSQEPTVAFLSAEQMLKAMLSSTGTEGLGDLSDPADKAISDTYNSRSGSLPSGNSLTQATGPTLIAATNLAGSVCAKAVSRDAANPESARDQRLFFREMDFSKGLGGQTSDGVVGSFTRIARNSWRREPTAEEVQDMLTFATEFSDGANATDVAQTKLLAISVCTAVLSSIDGLTY